MHALYSQQVIKWNTPTYRVLTAPPRLSGANSGAAFLSHSSNVHAQLPSGVRWLIVGLSLHLLLYFLTYDMSRAGSLPLSRQSRLLLSALVCLCPKVACIANNIGTYQNAPLGSAVWSAFIVFLHENLVCSLLEYIIKQKTSGRIMVNDYKTSCMVMQAFKLVWVYSLNLGRCCYHWTQALNMCLQVRVSANSLDTEVVRQNVRSNLKKACKIVQRNWNIVSPVWFDSLCPSQQIFSFVGTGLPVFNQY